LTISGTADRLVVRRPGEVSRLSDSGDPRAAGATPPNLARCANRSGQACGAQPVSDRREAGPTTEESEADAHAHVGVGGGAVMVSKLDVAILRTQARAALAGLGWKPAIAHAAVDAAVAAHGADLTLDRLIFESLRRCPAPKA
jgi:hypothetical protein